MKKFVLTAIGAKFIHSSLALKYLSRFAHNDRDHQLLCVEFTINQRVEFILGELFRLQPDVILFSTYIWNVNQIKLLLPELKKILPQTLLVLGGPEVTYEAERFLRENRAADLIMWGEGEWTFTELLDVLDGSGGEFGDVLGLTYRQDREIITNPPRETLDMGLLPFPYDADFGDVRDKIIYYESSRGCPYRCGYCLSSLEKSVRFMPLERVYGDLQRFLAAKVRQVKFIDRTFNCHKGHTMGVWRYLAEHDNGVTNFHFELTADLLDQEMLDFLKPLRKGLFQFEIGVQSTNPQTIAAINRQVDFQKLSQVVKSVKAGGNIHQHLDLIAGLPYEDYASFGRSFNDVYALAPEQLQLGFLKVLKGSAIYEQREKHGILFSDYAPYEVLATNYLPYEDLLRLKAIEEMVEIYYNSGKFQHVLGYLVGLFGDPFAFYEALADYWVAGGHHQQSQSKMGLCDRLYEFCNDWVTLDLVRFKRLLKYDLCLHEKPKKLPTWLDLDNSARYSEEIVTFYRNQAMILAYLPEYAHLTSKQIERLAHLEVFDGADAPKAVVFNYERRDLLGNGEAQMILPSHFSS